MTDRDCWDIREGENTDDLQNGYRILQAGKGFRFGMDAVLLAAFTRVKPGERVLDMGTGSGIIPVLLAARHENLHITGLEIQPYAADMAARSVAGNGLQDRIAITEGDIREAATIFGAASFDVVVSNPPYMTCRHGLVNPDKAAAAARHEILCTFRELAEQTARVLTGTGRFYLIHRPFRLAEILDVLREVHLEPKKMRLVFPFADREPNLVLLEACRGGRPRMQIEKPLIIYEKQGVYTEELQRIYAGGRI